MSLPSVERASMLVMAASWDDFRVDAADPCVVIVASDMVWVALLPTWVWVVLLSLLPRSLV